MKALCAYCLRKLPYFLFAFISLNANAQLNADFDVNQQAGCSPLVVQFKNLSTGSFISSVWDLGNGATSTQKDPSAIYINPGKYTIKLVVTDGSGNKDSIIKTAYITVYENPDVDFTGRPDEGCASLNVQFTDKSKAGSGTIAGWIWDFGDGITSTLQNPLHTYNIADTFNVILTVTNSFGCKKTLLQPSYIKVGGLVNAAFTYSYSNACKPPAAVTFINTSQSNGSLTYQWQFGDGGASTDKNPVYTYQTSGTFTVQLTATNETGCSNTYTQVISIGAAKADFVYDGACINEPVIFIDSSSPKPLSETWNFGDGSPDGTGSPVNHVYKNPGFYQVTLTADFGGCTDVVRKTIQTGEKAKADFNASGKRFTCNYPVSIQFNNNSAGATGYKWYFGDNTASSAENPVHTYNQPGQYTITLIAYNSNGCSDTLIKTNFIELGPPKILGIENLPFEDCAPKTVTFRPIITSGVAISSYKWTFGDNSTSTDSVPSHRYLNTGRYNVSLIVTTAEGCSDTLVMPNAVSLGKAPKPMFSADQSNICASTAVNFTDKSTGFVTDWLWIFGDGTTSVEQNPQHVYSDTGFMDVSLIVSQYGCYDTLTLDDYIYIKPPIAKFIYSVRCDDPFNYTFIDSSIGAKKWAWNFGDDSTSKDQSPTHTYASDGIYTVTLTVTNGKCSYRQTDSIYVVSQKPSFAYQALTTNFCKYDSIKFYATDYDPEVIKTFQWDFGDGFVTLLNVKNDTVYHSYNDAGNYTPWLIVRDINNCLDTINNNIQIPIYGPNAAFSNIGGACISSTITFKDESTTDGTHAITKWIWDYGDATSPDTLTTSPFTHTYQDTGLYNVSLKILDNNGCYDTVSTGAINITNPFANFSSVDTLTCSASGIQFLDSSIGVSMIYKWNFGDGQASASPAPLHNYTAEGLYDVQLSLTDKYGCKDTLLKPQYVRVANPVSGFELADTLFQCPPAKINPLNTSLNYNSLVWDFGDGNTSLEISPEHYYANAGIYPLKLVVQGYGNCADTFTKSLVLKGPYAIMNYGPFTGCNPLQVSFSAKAKNTIQYIWDFGNGVTESSSDSNFSYTYLKPGKFLPQLVIVDDAGCRVPVVNADTIVIFGVDTKFSAMRVLGSCDSSLYEFADSSAALFDEIDSYHWKFGDGDSSSLKNPSHYYVQPGVYPTSLNIETKRGCVAGFDLPLDVLIDTTPLISAVIPDSACINSTVTLTANVLNNLPENFSWKWDLGDGTNAYTKDTSSSYATAGLYNLYVAGTSAAGCADTIKHSIRVDPLPPTDAGFDTVICRGKSITLIPNGAAGYEWLPDATLSCLNCATPVANPLVNKTYYLTGTNAFGCKASDSVNILVKQPADVLASAPDTICVGNSIELKATGAELYNWIPAALVRNSTDSITTSSPPSTTNFMVIGRDTKGCFSDTAYALVHVYPYPILQIKDSVVTVEAGSEYQIITQSSEDVISWLWSPLNGLSCASCPQPLVKPMATQAYTVTAQNIAGCTVEKNITITVLCKNQNLYIPNTFSPNNDGMNDYFYPRGKGVFTVKAFRIYSRWGILVYERNNFPPNQQSYGWDGTYKGKVLKPDVYVFIAEVMCDNGTIISSKGNVTLLR